MIVWIRQSFPFSLILVSLCVTLDADEPVDYSRDIKPILRARCFSCHGPLKQEASLRLDTGASIRKGGENGSAVNLGAVDESLLLVRVSEPDESLRMPPEGDPLSDDVTRGFTHVRRV